MLSPEASTDPGRDALARPLRMGALVGGALFGAAAASLAFAGGLFLQAVLLLVPLGFFAGVPLGYLSSTRGGGLRLGLFGALGLLVGAFLGGFATALNVEGAGTLGEAALAAARLAAFYGAITLLFLALGVLLGRRAGSPRFRRPSPGEP
ncbi:MAG TPA: hypothetical protein VNZ52_10620 [Candidatus Thermoplasmatota archaeon]|nr:hypothetical protein [Candidatus Thermoplasmatota archaeon]